MWSMWNAPSDLDYYGQSGIDQEMPEEEQEIEAEHQEETNDDERDIAF